MDPTSRLTEIRVTRSPRTAIRIASIVWAHDKDDSLQGLRPILLPLSRWFSSAGQRLFLQSASEETFGRTGSLVK